MQLKEQAHQKLEAKKKKKRRMLSGSGHCLDTHLILFFNCFGDSTEPVDFPILKFGLCVDINVCPRHTKRLCKGLYSYNKAF